MALTEKEKTWFENQIQKYDEKGEIIELDNSSNLIKYTSSMRSDESLIKAQNPEEYVHALFLCLLCSPQYRYKVEKMYHEQHFKRGSSGAKDDETDYLLYDEEDFWLTQKSMSKLFNVAENNITYYLQNIFKTG